jgi:hypothetical protein
LKQEINFTKEKEMSTQYIELYKKIVARRGEDFIAYNELDTPCIVGKGDEYFRRATTRDYFIDDNKQVWNCSGYKFHNITKTTEGQIRLIKELMDSNQVHETGSVEFGTNWIHVNTLVVHLCALSEFEYYSAEAAEILPAIVLLLMQTLKGKLK